MGAYSVLSVGEAEFMAWKYEIPSDPFLAFVFTEQDRVIRPVAPAPEEWDDDFEPHELFYETNAEIVAQRLGSLGLSAPEIDRTIARHMNIDLAKVPLVLMDDDEFLDRYPRPNSVEEEAEWEKLGEEHENLRTRAEHTGLGGLAILRQLHIALADAGPHAQVRLTFEEIIDWAPAAELERIVLFKNHDVEVRIEHRYLTLARVHFTEHNFNLAFIDLAIALDLTTKDMLRRASKARGLDADIEDLFRKIGLMDALVFGTRILLDIVIDPALLGRVREAYNKRNNVVHTGARRFTMIETARAIQDVEQVLSLVEAGMEALDPTVVEQVAPADPPSAGG